MNLPRVGVRADESRLGVIATSLMGVRSHPAFMVGEVGVEPTRRSRGTGS